MKKILCIILTFLFLFSLYGCNATDSQTRYQVSFFYPRVKLTYGQTDSVISSELRDVYDRSRDLSYIVRLYLSGPASTDLYSPFPQDTRLVSLESAGSELHITLGGKGMSQINQLQCTLAYACLAKTCFSLTDIQSIHINTEQRMEDGLSEIVFFEDSLVLWDNISGTDSDETIDKP